MTDGDPRTEADVRELRAAVAELARRVAALEAAIAAGAIESAPARHDSATLTADQLDFASRPPAPVPAWVPRSHDAGWLATVGRTFMVFGGAFLLRALTESGYLAVQSGVWLGLAYAVVWLALAYRTRGLSSQLHGLSALLIGVPLIAEAALRFKYFSAGASGVALVLLTVATLGAASYRRCRILAGLASAAAIVAAFALAVSFGAFATFSLVLILAGLAALWVAYHREWHWLAWPTALAANAIVALLAVRAMAEPPRDNPFEAQLIHGALIAAYLGTFIIRTVLHDRSVLPFEVAQTAAVLVIGLAGSVAIARAHDTSVALVALPALIAAAMLYMQTFARIAPRFGRGAEFYYFGMTSLALALVGLSLTFSFPVRPVVVALGAVVAIAVGWRWGHPLLALQGGIAAVVAAAQCGLIAFAARSWLTTHPAWPSDLLPMGFVLATVAAALLIPRAIRDRESSILTAIERVALSAALVAGLGSLIVAAAAPVVSGAPPNAGVLATMRTIILAVSSTALAWIGRSARFVEMRWLAYAVLAIGAIKILAEDLPASRPATLFIALAAYGAALIAVPRLTKTTG